LLLGLRVTGDFEIDTSELFRSDVLMVMCLILRCGGEVTAGKGYEKGSS
jgi:hypothetical protein